VWVIRQQSLHPAVFVIAWAESHKRFRSETFRLKEQHSRRVALAFSPDLIFNHTAMATQQTFASAAVPLTASDRSAMASPPRPKSLWILDRWRDLLFFVGTPVLLIPLFTVAQKRWSAQDIYLFV